MRLYCIMNESEELLVRSGGNPFFGAFDLEDSSNNEGVLLQCWFSQRQAEVFAEEHYPDVKWEIVELIDTKW